MKAVTLAIVAILCASGCSLLFSEPAANEEPLGVSCIDQVCVVDKSIGTGPDRDFSSINAWVKGRSGDLVGRGVLHVRASKGGFEAGERLVGQSSGCTGLYVRDDEAGSNGPLLSLDAPTGECEPGERLLGDLTASAVTLVEVLGIGTVERGVLYADGTFTDNVVIDGSTTDPEHYMWLTAEPQHRHYGIAGAGVILEPEVAGHGIEILDDFTRIEWVEVTGWSVGAADSYDGIRAAADEILIQYVLVHDDGAAQGSNPDCNGINVEADGVHVVVKNSFVHDLARSGIAVHKSVNVELEIFNSTVLRASLNDNASQSYGAIGSREGAGVTIRVVNTIAADAPGSDFLAFGTTDFSWGESDFNLSGDDSAPGSSSLLTIDPNLLFRSPARPVNLHLAPASPARDMGTDLTMKLVDDIDGDPRPQGDAWDIGADEY